MIDLTIQIQQIPAPTFGEAKRAEFVRAMLIENLEDVSIDALGNVFARLPGKKEGRPLIVSAHTERYFRWIPTCEVKREAGDNLWTRAWG